MKVPGTSICWEDNLQTQKWQSINRGFLETDQKSRSQLLAQAISFQESKLAVIYQEFCYLSGFLCGLFWSQRLFGCQEYVVRVSEMH